jgi:hypothetical protein
MQNASRLHTRPRSFSQPVHHGTSPDQSASPSFVFLPDENDESGLTCVRYRGYIDSSSEENMALSFPAMNPEVARAQSMRDKRERDSQELRRKPSMSKGEKASGQPRPGSQLGSVSSGPQAGHIQDGRRMDGTDPDRISIDRNETSRIDSLTPSSSETANDDNAADGDGPGNENSCINGHSTPLNGTGFADLTTPPMERPHTSPRTARVASEPQSPISPVRYHYPPHLVGLPSPTSPRRSRTVSSTGMAIQGTTSSAPNAIDTYSNGSARSSSLRAVRANAQELKAANGARGIGDATADSLAAQGDGNERKAVEVARVKKVLTREKWRLQER